jgi:hypothetical protein
VIHKGIYFAGVLIVKGVVFAGHAIGHALATQAAAEAATAKLLAAPIVKGIAAHPIMTAFIGAGILAGPITTIAYFDKAAAEKLLAEDPTAAFERTIKVSVAGNLINGEFTTITGPFNNDRDLILLGRYDEDKQEMAASHVIKANQVESRLGGLMGAAT